MNTELSHEALNRLIPWYINGTLSQEECSVLERHLEDCTECRSEVQWMREVGMAMSDLASDAPPVQPSFHKALAAVERWEQSKNFTPFAGISNWWRAIWNPILPLARYAMVVQLGLIICLCVALWFPHRELNPAYTVLSGAEPSNTGGAKLTISFAPQTTMDQVQKILSDVSGTIVGGPSANGICIVQLSTTADRDPEIQATIQKLRDNKAIRFVERLP